MDTTKRQTKITYLFGKSQHNHHNDPEAEERKRELLEDNKRLKKILMERESYAFQLQRSLLPQPKPFQAKHQAAINSEISSLGGETIMRSKLAKQKERLDTYLRLFGIQVKTYNDERCVVMYNVQVQGKLVAQYAVQFTKAPEESDWTVCKYHLPLGMRLDILSDYQPMSLEYLRQLQVALVAYHDRQEQIARLKEEIPSHVFVAHNMSVMSVELVFPMVEKKDTKKPVKTAVELRYDPFQNRPKQIKIVQNLVTEYSEEFEAVLSSQFEIMKYLSLPQAFVIAVKKDSENNFYCPDEDEHENLDTQAEEQEYTERIQQRSRPTETRPYSTESEMTNAIPPMKSSHKKHTKSQQQFNQRQTLQPPIDENGSVSDDESISFTELRRQMKGTKKQSREEGLAFKKPLPPKSGAKRATQQQVETDDDDAESGSTGVFRESNKTKHNASDSRISSYQVTDDELTSGGSYVFVPESKKKAKSTSSVKKNKANVSKGKENNKVKSRKGKHNNSKGKSKK